MFAPLQRPCGDLSGIKTSKGGKKDTLKTDAKMCQAIRGGGEEGAGWGGGGGGGEREKEEEDRQTEIENTDIVLIRPEEDRPRQTGR